MVTEHEDAPLTEQERAFVAEQLAKRRSIANRFATFAAIATALFLVQQALEASGGSRSKTPAHVGLGMAVVLVMGLLVWYFGYRLVFLMKKDLAAGRKQKKTGKIEAIESHGNAYGEMITHVTVGGEKFVTRGGFFDRCRGGERVMVVVLPRSRVAIAGTLLE